MASREYYDGAHDALVEAEQEIQAAWIITPVKREHFDSDSDFWREVALEAVRSLAKSYDSDKEYVL
jgi:hypothetical protein